MLSRCRVLWGVPVLWTEMWRVPGGGRPGVPQTRRGLEGQSRDSSKGQLQPSHLLLREPTTARGVSVRPGASGAQRGQEAQSSRAEGTVCGTAQTS